MSLKLSFFRLKKAFTLAEVLITLGIIGVVAAITIPTLISNYQKSQYVTQLKKTYSTLNQAFAKYAADNGCTGDLECTGLFSDEVATNKVLWDEFVNNYLKVVKNCNITNNEDCFPSNYTLLNSSGSLGNFNGDGSYKIVLNDGTSVAFARTSNCTEMTMLPENNPLYGTCGYVMIDLNGQKPPNKIGRDMVAGGGLSITSVINLVV